MVIQMISSQILRNHQLIQRTVMTVMAELICGLSFISDKSNCIRVINMTWPMHITQTIYVNQIYLLLGHTYISLKTMM